MWYVFGSGTQTAQIGTEQTLTSAYVNGTHVFKASVLNLQPGDAVEFRIYVGGYLIGLSQIGPAQPLETLIQSPPVVSTSTVSVSLKQVAGSPRTFAWSLLGDSPKLPQPRQFSADFSSAFA